MRRQMLLVAGALAFAMLPALRAQDTMPQDPVPQTMGQGQTMKLTPDQMVRFYDSKLTLTDAQKVALRPIVAERQQKMQDLRGDTSGRPRERMKKLQSITADADKKINALLTPDQQKKYAEVEAQMKEQAKERRQQKSGGN